jgi:hypothetical protein
LDELGKQVHSNVIKDIYGKEIVSMNRYIIYHFEIDELMQGSK